MFSFAAKPLQVIAWRYVHVTQRFRGVNLQELSKRYPLELLRERLTTLTDKQFLGLFVHADPTLSYAGLLDTSARAFANGLDDLADPRISPVYADFGDGFPPALIQAGTKEILLSTAVRFFQKLEAANQDATLDIYEGMWHVFQEFPLPETEVAVDKAAAFINAHLR